MSNALDLSFCASLLRGITDHIQNEMCPSPSGEDAPAAIGRIRAVSAWATEALRTALQAHWPGIGWAPAEDDVARWNTGSQGRCWIYDPIDGAYHHAQALPLWSASLVLVDAGRPVASFIYDPAAREMYQARAGEGAYRNGARIQCSERRSLQDSVVATALPPYRQYGPKASGEALASLGRVNSEVFVVRCMASASLQLAFVADGRLDGFWELGNDVGDWLAGALLATEAGATVTDGAGGRLTLSSSGIVAAPGQLHRPLQAAAFAAS